jgi:cytochrome d ubiquinol oxidase subunit I
VAPLFFAFRLMVGVGMLMLAVSWTTVWMLRRRAWVAQQLPRAMLGVLSAMSFSGWLATLAGWYVTEIGRQPFIVYGLIRTAEVASKTPASHIALTLAAYLTLYAVLIVAFISVVRYLAEHTEDSEALPAGSGQAIAQTAAAAGQGARS